MHKFQQAHASNIDTVRMDFMDVYHEIHQNEVTSKKKSKNRRKCEARRGIEVYRENKHLQAQLHDWWEDL
jgi:hypothetical protein